MQSVQRHLLALGLLVLAAPLLAQDPARPIEIHGFGSWTYGRTNQNYFLDGHPEGDYRHVSVALNLSKRVDDRMSIQVQGWIRETHDVSQVELDYAFVDYKLTDQLSFRIGQVKHPFGIYTEVFDVGTLRPFIALPQGFYGPAGFAGESYKGIGASGAATLGAWSLAYDAYAGGNDVERFAVPEHFYRGSALQGGAEDFERQSNRNVLGGRVVLQAPRGGLSFGGSSYSGTTIGTANEPESKRYTVVAGQVGYRSNAWTLESEIAHAVQSQDEHSTGGYVLAAYRLTPDWQVAAQYDKLTTRYVNADVTAAPSLQLHREVAFAVSRWLSRAFVLKTEYHHVSGNRLAMPHPEDLAAVVAANGLRLTTHLVQFGAQFTY
jgi:hypothetical protein